MKSMLPQALSIVQNIVQMCGPLVNLKFDIPVLWGHLFEWISPIFIESVSPALKGSISPTFWRKAQMRWWSLFCAIQFHQ